MTALGISADSRTSADSHIPAWAVLALANGPVSGSETRGGYSTAGDALAVRSADGVDLQVIWDTLRDANALYNEHRNAVVSHLAYSTTNAAEAVPQSTTGFKFELATEFGEPRGNRLPDHLLIGADFHDYDTATRLTWQAIRAMSARQIEALVNGVMEADSRLVTGKILERLFDPTPRTTPEGNISYGVFCNDGMQPLDYLGKTFADSHTHVLVSGASVVDSGDLDDMVKLVVEHGYARTPNSHLLLFANMLDLEKVSTFRAGVESRSGGPIASHSWIPTDSAPPYLTDQNIVGKVAPSEFNGLKILGQYGELWCTATELIPQGHMAVVATGGPNSLLNPVMYREHSDSAYRGLLHIPGPRPAYPLQDSFFVRSFGTGIRHRGSVAICQIKASGDYEPPVLAT